MVATISEKRGTNHLIAGCWKHPSFLSLGQSAAKSICGEFLSKLAALDGHKGMSLDKDCSRHRSNRGDLCRCLLIASGESQIAHFRPAFVTEFMKGSIFPFAPARIIEEFVERDHSAWNYSVSQQIENRSGRAVNIGIQVQ